MEAEWILDRSHLWQLSLERPNQAITCNNQLPRVAFSDLPTLPSVPEHVDPDHWLQKVHGQFYKRRIQDNG